MPISFVRLHVFKCDVCMRNCLMIKPKNIFEYLICFWKCFCLSLEFWKFFQKAKSVLLKNSFVSIFASASQVRFLTTRLQKCGSEFLFLSKFYTKSRDSFTGHSRDIASYESCPVQMRFFTSNSRVPCESLSCEMSGFSVFKEAHNESFSKSLFCLPYASLNPKHIFH